MRVYSQYFTVFTIVVLLIGWPVLVLGVAKIFKARNRLSAPSTPALRCSDCDFKVPMPVPPNEDAVREAFAALEFHRAQKHPRG